MIRRWQAFVTRHTGLGPYLDAPDDGRVAPANSLRPTSCNVAIIHCQGRTDLGAPSVTFIHVQGLTTSESHAVQVVAREQSYTAPAQAETPCSSPAQQEQRPTASPGSA